MAYYAFDAAREPPQRVTTDAGKEPVRVDGVGAYYAYDAAHESVQPINGLALSGSDKMADEAARVLIGRRRPVMIARTWARHVTDVVWQDELGDSQLTLLPLTDGELAAVKRSAFGSSLPLVGVLAVEPMAMTVAAKAFAGTPYELADSYAVYSLADKSPIARPLYLFVARLRDADSADGGNGLMTAAASALGGKLVYIVKLPLPARARGPGAAFRLVFSATRQPNAPLPYGPGMPPGGSNRPPISGLSGAGFRTKGALGMSDSTIGLAAVLGVVGVGYLLKRFAS